MERIGVSQISNQMQFKNKKIYPREPVLTKLNE